MFDLAFAQFEAQRSQLVAHVFHVVLQLLHTYGGAAVLIQAGAVLAQLDTRLLSDGAWQAQRRKAFKQLRKAIVGGIQGVITDFGKILDRGEGVGGNQALLVGTFDMPAEGIHQAQHTTLLTVVRHFQQGLGLQLVNRLAECMLL
ncbi:hypothetical protein D9M71_444280 [compost metagenome]